MTGLLACSAGIAPAVYLSGALLAAVFRAHCWRVLDLATRAMAAVTFLRCVLLAGASENLPGPLGTEVEAVVAALVAFLGWVIGRYAQRYLEGELGQSRFVVALLFTLGAVSLVVVGANLALVIAAWAASSAGLHHLLTFYRDRPAAIIVAHKKFLASRLAEALLVLAAIALYRQWGTLDIQAIDAQAQAMPHLPSSAAVAAVLIAAAVILKCAQLPLHGWLIQVMEAPTPVSALLHAGVVNLGGYVLIRLAPLISAAPVARGLLVVVGSLTAAIAGLVMLTRVTIKVRLAWSTCSQMGFMLMECGLGLYDLALLHLIAHALYKAHAFLAAGDAVRQSLARALAASACGRKAKPSLLLSLLALPGAAIITAGSAFAWQFAFGTPPLPWIAAVCVACAIATLLWPLARQDGAKPRAAGVLAAVGGTQIYLGWHALLGKVFALAPATQSSTLAGVAALVMVALYFFQCLVALRPDGALATVLHPYIYAGLYLDERFTRLTFRLWPVRAAAPEPSGPIGRELETTRSAA